MGWDTKIGDGAGKAQLDRRERYLLCVCSESTVCTERIYSTLSSV